VKKPVDFSLFPAIYYAQHTWTGKFACCGRYPIPVVLGYLPLSKSVTAKVIPDPRHAAIGSMSRANYSLYGNAPYRKSEKVSRLFQGLSGLMPMKGPS